MKKMLVLLLTLLISTTFIHALADISSAGAYESGDFAYNILKDGTVEINGIELTIMSRITDR